MASASRGSGRQAAVQAAVGSILLCRLTTICLLAALGAGALLPRVAGCAEASVRVRGGEHQGFARLVFDWPRTVSYEVGIESGELVVTFGEPAAYDVSVLDHDLEDYIDGGAVRQEGATIRFPLKQRLGLKHFTIGPKLVVDLIQGGGAQEPAPADAAPPGDGAPAGETAAPERSAVAAVPTEPAAAAGPMPGPMPNSEPLPRVTVVAGRLDDVDRLVFNWPGDVGYRIDGEAPRAAVVFDRPGEIDLAGYRPSALSRLEALAVKPSEDGLRVDLSLAPGVRIHHQGDGGRIVVELSGPQIDGAAAMRSERKPDGEPTAGDRDVRPATLETPPERRPVAPPAEPAMAEPSDPEPAPATAVPQVAAAESVSPPDPARALADAAAVPVAEPVVPAVAAAVRSGRGGPKADAQGESRPTGDVMLDATAPLQLLPDELAAEWRAALAGERRATTPPAMVATLPKVELSAALTADAATIVEPVSGAEAQGGEGGLPLVDVSEALVEDEWTPIPGRDLRPEPAAAFALNFTSATAMAAFRRGSHLWFVFDRSLPDGISRRIEAVVPGARTVEQFEVEGATVIRLRLPGQLAPRMFQEETAWKIDLRPRSGRPEVPASYAIDEDVAGASLRVLMPGGTRVVQITDPELGDRLAVVPVARQGVGLSKPIRLAQLNLLPSYQGLVAELRDDSVAVSVSDLEISMTASGGLAASSMPAATAHGAEGAPPFLGQRLFDLPAWRRSPDALTKNYKQALLTRINTTSGREADIARLDLARFYFAHGLSLESLSLLGLMETNSPEFLEDPEFLVIKGASQVLVEDYAGARKTLANPILAGEWEALPWQAAIAAIAQEWDYAAWAFERSSPLLDDYVEPVRTRLQLLAAEARLGIGDQEGVAYYLKRIRPQRLSQSERAQADFVEAGKRLLDDRFGTAEPLLRKVASGPHAATRVRARMALIDLAAAQPDADREAIIADLERLRFAWRGDAFESALERRLAEAYYQEGRYRKALTILDSVAEFGPDLAIAADADHRAREIFRELYVDPPETGLTPLTAVALYEEFRHLAPVGEDGVAMVDGLIEQLVEVDLLDRAAALLENQIQFNLSGEAKARAGERLARIRLDDRLPNRALDALDGSAVEDPPEDLAHGRLLLRAEAFGALGQVGEALAELAQDSSDASLRMQADLLRKQEQWEQAAVVLDSLRPVLRESGDSVSAEAAADLANLAIAYSMIGDSEPLRELGLRYQGSLPAGRDGETFDLLTSGVDGEMLTTVAEELEGATRIQTLLTSLKNELQ